MDTIPCCPPTETPESLIDDELGIDFRIRIASLEAELDFYRALRSLAGAE